MGSKRQKHRIGIDIEKVRKFASISNSYVQKKGIVLVRSMGLENNSDNNIDMNKQGLYGRMMGHIKIYRVS